MLALLEKGLSSINLLLDRFKDPHQPPPEYDSLQDQRGTQGNFRATKVMKILSKKKSHACLQLARLEKSQRALFQQLS